MKLVDVFDRVRRGGDFSRAQVKGFFNEAGVSTDWTGFIEYDAIAVAKLFELLGVPNADRMSFEQMRDGMVRFLAGRFGAVQQVKAKALALFRGADTGPCGKPDGCVDVGELEALLRPMMRGSI